MVITASLAILSVIVNVELFIANLNILNSGIYLPDTIDYALVEALNVTYALLGALYLFEAISFMLLGVKLIKSVNRGKIVAEMKGKVIVSLVFVSIATFLELCTDTVSFVNIATIILLSLALGKAGSEKAERENFLLQEQTASLNNFENETSGSINNSETSSDTLNANFTDETSEITEFTDKIIRLKALKENGAITTEEFEILVADALKLNKVDIGAESENMDKFQGVKETKNTRTKKNITTKNNKES